MSTKVCARCRFPNDGKGPLCSVCAGISTISRQAQQSSPGALWLDDLSLPERQSPSSAPHVRHGGVPSRAERRAQVRRLRLLAAQTAPARTARESEALVLDVDSVRRLMLVAVLQELGFRVVSASSLEGIPNDWPRDAIAAAFIDIGQSTGDGGDGVDLCRQLRDAGWMDGNSPSALVLTAARLPPADRVRAGLAGCDAVLDQALSRGSVARVLDGRGVVLPSDRRSL